MRKRKGLIHYCFYEHQSYKKILFVYFTTNSYTKCGNYTKHNETRNTTKHQNNAALATRVLSLRAGAAAEFLAPPSTPSHLRAIT